MNRWLVGWLSLVWCSQVHHCGFSSRRPGFESRHEHHIKKYATFHCSSISDLTCDKILASRSSANLAESLGNCDTFARLSKALLVLFWQSDFLFEANEKNTRLNRVQITSISPLLPQSKKEGTSTAAQVLGL